MDSDSNSRLLLKHRREATLKVAVNVDNKPTLWLLHKPEQTQYKDPNLYLWVRRCEVFTTQEKMINYFDSLGIIIRDMSPHELFPELTIITDTRGYKWYLCQATVNPLT